MSLTGVFTLDCHYHTHEWIDNTTLLCNIFRNFYMKVVRSLVFNWANYRNQFGQISKSSMTPINFHYVAEINCCYLTVQCFLKVVHHTKVVTDNTYNFWSITTYFLDCLPYLLQFFIWFNSAPLCWLHLQVSRCSAHEHVTWVDNAHVPTTPTVLPKKISNIFLQESFLVFLLAHS